MICFVRLKRARGRCERVPDEYVTTSEYRTGNGSADCSVKGLMRVFTKVGWNRDCKFSRPNILLRNIGAFYYERGFLI